MIKYCFIEDLETGRVMLGAGCSDEYYREIGMLQQDVEQSEKDSLWYLAKKCPHYTPEEKEQMEEDRINNLIMTPLDFIKFLEQLGISYEQIQNYLKEHVELDKQLKYCSSVYCGVVKQILPITVDGITITPEMAEQAFKAKHGER